MREFHGRLRKEETNDLGSATFQIWLRSGTHYSIDGFTIDHTATTLLPFPRSPPLLPSQSHLRHVHNTKAQRIHKSTELLVPITSSVLNITGFRKAASRPRSMRFI